jgi:hypothetical protein
MALPFMALGVHQGNGVFAASYMAVAYWFFVALLAMAQHEHQTASAMRHKREPSPRQRQMAAAVSRMR